MFRKISNNEESLPEKIVQIIVNLSKGEDAPLWLVLGPQAVELATQSAETVPESDRKWCYSSLSSA